MKHKNTSGSASEGNQKAEGPAWSSNQQIFKWQIAPLFTAMQSDKSDLRALIKRHTLTAILIAALMVPLLVLSVALKSFLIFGATSLIYILSGSLGSLLIMRVRKINEATSIVPKVSKGCQRPDLKSDTLGTDKKAA